MKTETKKESIYVVFQIIAAMCAAFSLGIILTLLVHISGYNLIISADSMEEMNTLAQEGIRGVVTGTIVFGVLGGMALLFVMAGPLTIWAAGVIHDEFAKRNQASQKEDK